MGVLDFVAGFRVSTDVASWECGIGALMPWVRKIGTETVPVLYISTYLAETNQGSGAGLYAMGLNREVELIDQHNGCHAGRMVHTESNQLFIANSVIDGDGDRRTVPTFTGTGQFHRITAWCRSLTDPATNVYALTMAGLVFRVDTGTLGATQIADAKTALGIVAQPHFKGAYVNRQGTPRLYVANNTDSPDGRLAMWDGTTWTTLSSLGGAINVDGPDGGSPVAWGLDGGPSGPLCAVLYMMDTDGTSGHRRFRIPLATWSYNNYLHQEWMRLRIVTSDRLLANIYGTFFEVGQQAMGFGTFAQGNLYPNLSPVCRHLRQIGDFTAFDGNFVFGGNDNPRSGGNNAAAGQPTGGIDFARLDDLWSWGKPRGIGYWMKAGAMASGAVSDPMLAAGYENKTIHLYNGGAASISIRIGLIAQATEYVWLDIPVDAGQYLPIQLEQETSWIRLTALNTVDSLTAWVSYG